MSLVEDIPAVEDQAATEARSLTSVGKALAILDVFQDAPWTLGVTEVAHRAHLPKSTTFRLLTSLERCGYVERREESYCLGKRLFELGNQVAWCRPRRLREIAVPYMCDLFETAKQTVHLAVLDGPDVLYIEKLHGHKPSPAPTQVGGRVSARTTALGKAMLAHCDRATVDIALLEPPALRTPYTIVLPHLFLVESQWLVCEVAILAST